MFTFGETTVVAQMTSQLEPMSVLLSIAALVFGVCTLFIAALFTKINSNLFRNLVVGVLVAALSQMILFMIFMFNGFSFAGLFALGALGILITGFYILIDLV